MRAIVTHILVLLVLFPFVAKANQQREDSLLAVLATKQADTARVKTFNELFKANYFVKPDRALAFAEEGLALARKIQYWDGIGRLTNNIGVWYSKRGNYPKALAALEQTREAWMHLGREEELADCKMNIGNVWYKQGKYDMALENYSNALQDYRRREDTVHSLDAINNIGSVFMDQGRYSEALEAFMSALKERERQNDPVQIAVSCANIGTIYQLEGRLDDAMHFYQRSLSLSREVGDKFGEVAALCNVGEIELEQNAFPMAKIHFQNAFAISTAIDDQYAKSTALLGLARIFEFEDQSDSANFAFSEALEISRSIGRQQGVVLALTAIGRSKLKRNDLAGAAASLSESLQLSNQINSRDLSCENYRLLSEVYHQRSDYKSAFQYQKRYIELHDSIYTQEKGKQIAELQEIYAAQQSEDEIQRLTLQNAQDQLRITRSSMWSLVLAIILIPVLLLTLIFYMRYRQKQKRNNEIALKNEEIKAQRDLLENQNNQIREINVSLEKMITVRTKAVSDAHAELDTFLYQSAHALRRPLLRVDGLVGLIEAEENPAVRTNLRGKLNSTLGDMDQLLHKLIAVTESSHRDLQLVEIQLEKMLAEIALRNQNGASFKIQAEPGFLIVSDQYLLEKMLHSVIENAFQSLDPAIQKGTVIVKIEEDEAFVTLKIIDDGHGIAAEQLPNVFEMFFRGTNRSGGHGLGLFVAQKICTKLHGTIGIESTPHKGTTVTINLPRHII